MSKRERVKVPLEQLAARAINANGNGNGTSPARLRSIPPTVVIGEGLRGRYTHFGFEVEAALGYRSARVADKEGRAPSRVGAIAHERIDRLRLQYQSREFIRNNGIYKGMIGRASAYVVGSGFKLVCKSSSPRWNKQVEKGWSKFWCFPETTAQLSGSRVERLVCEELLTTGESVTLLTQSGKLALLEPEQMIGPQWLKQGTERVGQEPGERYERAIERDQYGAIKRFWLAPYNPISGVPLLGDSKPYDPESVVYVSLPERPSSNRAVPPCQSSFPMLHRINDLCDSEALSAQLQARIVGSITRQSGPPTAASIATLDPSRSVPIKGDPTQNFVTEIPFALLFHGSPGDEIKGMERTSPSSSFPDSMEMFFRLLGLPLGLPLEVTLLNWTKSNFSQSRAVVDQAYTTTFLGIQDVLADLFHSRIYLWWLQGEIEEGRVLDRDDKEDHEWVRPAAPWIDPKAEAEAQGEKMDRGLATHGGSLKSLDMQRETFLLERKQEIIEAITIAQEIEEETGVAVPWEPLAGFKVPSKPAELLAAEEVEEGEEGEGVGDSEPGGPSPAGKPIPSKKVAARRRN